MRGADQKRGGLEISMLKVWTFILGKHHGWPITFDIVLEERFS